MTLLTRLAALSLLVVTGVCAAEDQAPLEFGLHAPGLAKLITGEADPVPFTEQAIYLTAEEFDGLRKTSLNEAVDLPAWNSALTVDQHEVLRFRRVNPYAKGAQIRELGADGVKLLKPTGRLYFLASGHATAAALIIDPVSGKVTGFVNRAGQSAELSGMVDGAIEIRMIDSTKTGPNDSNQCLTQVEDQPHDPLAMINSGIPLSQRAPIPAGVPPDYQAEIAVDTDNEWMTNSFGNNTTNATTFIEDIFMFMNVFYERDVSLNLLISDTTLRTTPDPYIETDVNEFLDEFSEYWRVNQVAVPRDFAVLFSGRSISGGSFSGIAWLDVYCEKGFVFNGGMNTAGSYSVNRIGSSRTASNTAQFVGHEIGHNLGSPHTHCYVPVLDSCFNLESGCFAGSVSCPVPEGNGTIMSYCHFNAPSGGADCGLSREEFHPEVVNLFNANIISNFPACIETFVGGNSAPVANPENYAMDEDTSLYIAPPGVLANDTDAEFDPLIAIQDGSLSGLTLNTNGSFTYTPAANFAGVVTFTYHANDTTSDSPTTNVVIVVQDVVEPPDYLFRNSFEGDTPP